MRSPRSGPADADFHLTLHDNRLDLDAAVRQPQIQPLTIKGNLPVDLKAIAQNKQLDPKSPVALSIELPRSSLGFLAGATKALRFIQGDVAIDVRVGGLIGKPTLAGSLELNIPAARAENITVPAIRDFHVRLAFTEKELRCERFNGEIGGGKINLSGNVGFAKLTNPTLDLTATARDVLAARDDNLTARVNADVRLTGPLDGATVAGRIGITKSRYLKDIDIVPLNLPGKPAPAPPAAAPSSNTSEGRRPSRSTSRRWTSGSSTSTSRRTIRFSSAATSPTARRSWTCTCAAPARSRCSTATWRSRTSWPPCRSAGWRSATATSPFLPISRSTPC